VVPQGLLREHSVRITPRLTSATLWDETRFGRRENLLRLKRVTLNDKAWGNSQDTPLPREKEEAEPPEVQKTTCAKAALPRRYVEPLFLMDSHSLI
jgi:hypothetical protein